MILPNGIKFLLNGNEISIVAEAPKDITLEQLLKQCDRIKPYYRAECGIRPIREGDGDTGVVITYDDVRTVSKYPEWEIMEVEE